MTRLRLLAACVIGVPVLAATPVAVHEITSVSAGETPAVSGPPEAPPSPEALSPARDRRFSLLQMNLCLSGLASCLQYPESVREATAVIRARRPNAVTLNEVCARDVATIAARTGYHRRFTTVPYQGRPLPCRSPAGRGVFGNAVLVRGTVSGSADGRYAAQDPLEQRRWLCVTTVRPLTVCTTHLEAQLSLSTIAIRHRQCAELADVLAVRARRGPTIAAGDVNGFDSCAPAGMWTRTDRSAPQKPGLQHAYGSAARLRNPAAGIIRAASTDHDFLLVTARLVRRAGR
jgi:endonuclease/exonuclease/phosphatase family metal-dependent hydrolase